MFGINIPRFGRSRFPFSKPGGFNVAWFEISEKRSSNGVEQLQQCAMINKVLIYIRQHPQLKKNKPHHYLQPPTQCQCCLENANARSSCDEQPAVMRLRVSTQHLHSLDANTLVQQGRLEKRTRVYCHLPQVSARQVLLGSLKATILDPQVLTDGQL